METATSSYADTTSLSAPGEQKPAEQGRLLVWQANVTMTVWNISNAVASANALAEKHSGFIEDRSDGREHSASLTLRVPSRTFTAALDGLECLGDITSRYVRSKDVTEQYVDTEARLKNHAALRDRLRQLLEKATEIKDILAIESELNRVQSDIDAMEARMKSLKGKADYATIDLTFERKPVPGPLGYLCKGIWWGVEKLFIIRK
jgi:hypothetical protein